MALIECPECQKRISDKALACPSCGHPFAGVADPTPRDIAGHGIPALFSFFIPGLGHLIKGDFLGAIMPYGLAFAAFQTLDNLKYRLLALLGIWVAQLIDTYKVKEKKTTNWGELFPTFARSFGRNTKPKKRNEATQPTRTGMSRQKKKEILIISACAVIALILVRIFGIDWPRNSNSSRPDITDPSQRDERSPETSNSTIAAKSRMSTSPAEKSPEGKPVVESAVETGQVFERLDLAEATKFTNECKIDTTCDAEKKWSIHPFQWSDNGTVAYIITRTETGYCGSGGCTDNLIVLEGAQWKVLAAIFGGIEELNTKTNGVRDIALARKSSAKTRFVWNDTEYRPAR